MSIYQRVYDARTRHPSTGGDVERAAMRPLPEQLLSDSTVIDALARRDFGTVFAAAHRRGISWNALHEATGIKADRISEYARAGYLNPKIDTVERIADGLRIPGWMVGLAARHWEATPPADSGTEMSAVNRRQLLQGSLAASLVMPLSLPDTARLKIEEALDYGGVEDVTDVEMAAERYSGGYQGRAPNDMFALLAGELLAAAPLLKMKHSTSIERDLARAVAQLGGMAAIVLHDMGRHDEASAWFLTAAKAARQSRDRLVLAWVQARRAMVPLNYGAPRIAARIAQQAREAAGSNETTAAAALAAAVAARAYALTGQQEPAVATLRDAERIGGNLPTPEAADTWLGYCAQKHHVHASQAYTALGDTAAANRNQAAGIGLSTRTGMTRTLLLLDGAMCIHTDGDSMGACEAAVEAFSQAPGRFRDGLVHRRALALYRSMPDTVRRSSTGRTFAEVLELGTDISPCTTPDV